VVPRLALTRAFEQSVQNIAVHVLFFSFLLCPFLLFSSFLLCPSLSFLSFYSAPDARVKPHPADAEAVGNARASQVVARLALTTVIQHNASSDAMPVLYPSISFFYSGPGAGSMGSPGLPTTRPPPHDWCSRRAPSASENLVFHLLS
jgi:hypothetical protein